MKIKDINSDHDVPNIVLVTFGGNINDFNNFTQFCVVMDVFFTGLDDLNFAIMTGLIMLFKLISTDTIAHIIHKYANDNNNIYIYFNNNNNNNDNQNYYHDEEFVYQIGETVIVDIGSGMIKPGFNNSTKETINTDPLDLTESFGNGNAVKMKEYKVQNFYLHGIALANFYCSNKTEDSMTNRVFADYSITSCGREATIEYFNNTDVVSLNNVRNTAKYFSENETK